jgi:hypothetical protein
MSDAIVETYDESTGRLQVSANMLGFVCRKTGTGNTVARTGGNTNPSAFTIDTTGFTYPIIAVQTNGFAAALYGMRSGINGAYFASSGAIGSPYTYYIYEWTPMLPANNALFQLYTDSGQCSFSSGYWPLKVPKGIPMGETAGGSGTYTMGGRSLAYACSNVGGHSRARSNYCYIQGQPVIADPDGQGLETCRGTIRGRIDGKLYGGVVHNNGTTVNGANISVDDVEGSFGTYSEYRSGYADGWDVPNTVMVVDVTGIPIGATFF